jgi:opacity protein-like surface antigen
MRKFLCTLIIVILIGAATELRSDGFFDRTNIRLFPGAYFALDGHYNDAYKLRKVLNLGVNGGLGIRFGLTNNTFLELSASETWLPVKKEFRPFSYKEKHPALIMPMYFLNWVFYYKSNYAAEPYLTFGAGISPWKFTRGGLFSRPWKAPANSEENFSDTSFGLNVGLGLEVFLFQKISVFTEAKYYYFFTRNVPKFGTDDFNQQDFLGINLGVIFYFKKI